MSSMVEQITTRQNPDEDCQSVVAALYAAADYRYRPSEDNLLSMMNYIGTYAGYLKPEYANNVLLAAAVLKAKVPDALIVDLLTMTCEWSKQVRFFQGGEDFVGLSVLSVVYVVCSVCGV